MGKTAKKKVYIPRVTVLFMAFCNAYIVIIKGNYFGLKQIYIYIFIV